MKDGLFRWFHIGAAQWFVRLRAGRVTPRLDAKFRRWLAADPSNEVDFEKQELAWELAGELAKDEEIQTFLKDVPQAVPAPPQRAPRYMLSWSAAAIVLVALTVGIGTYIEWPGADEVYATAVGEQRTVVLPDQSRMVLNTATQVRVAFRRNARVVELDHGEATFLVTHDPRRPFEVNASHGTARALGTQFNVLATAQGVTVSVLSGKVEVIAPDTAETSGSQSAVLEHGQQVTYTSASLSPVQAANAKRIGAWHSGRIAFEDIELGQALTEFNRYGKTPIELSDASLTHLRISGVFRIGETEAFLRALNTAFNIDAAHREGAVELRARETD